MKSIKVFAREDQLDGLGLGSGEISLTEVTNKVREQELVEQMDLNVKRAFETLIEGYWHHKRDQSFKGKKVRKRKSKSATASSTGSKTA